MTQNIRDYIFNINSKFKAYDRDTVLAILKNAAAVDKKKTKHPTMIVVAGPSGSGKSTIISNLVDIECFQEKYINAEFFSFNKFSDIEDENERMQKSAAFALSEVDRLIKEKKSFIYETVFSNGNKLELIKKAKVHGFKIITIFVFTENSNIVLDRINKRAQEGGISVNEDKVLSKYKFSLMNADQLRSLSDEFYQINNSKTKEVVSKP